MKHLLFLSLILVAFVAVSVATEDAAEVDEAAHELEDDLEFKAHSSQHKCKTFPENDAVLVSLSCPAGKSLEILRAFYGTPSSCPYPRKQKFGTSCPGSDVTHKLRRNCEGLNTCSFAAGNTLFGDPCEGTLKRLVVVYDCEPSKCKTFQEHDTAELSCPRGYEIDIIKASYGLPGACPNPVASTACNLDVTRIVSHKCDERRKCSFPVENTVLGGEAKDPCVGTPKHLAVVWECERRRKHRY